VRFVPIGGGDSKGTFTIDSFPYLFFYRFGFALNTLVNKRSKVNLMSFDEHAVVVSVFRGILSLARFNHSHQINPR
jgi:hypothetical protein